MARTMNKLAALALLAATAALASSVIAQDRGVKALREAPVNQSDVAPDLYKQSTPADGFGRAYRQQPPLIPHKIDGYQISTDNNACMTCHDWPGNTRVKAPKISETHYVDRQGAPRYFCTQCHVPQADAKPLVGNTFENATQVK